MEHDRQSLDENDHRHQVVYLENDLPGGANHLRPDDPDREKGQRHHPVHEGQRQVARRQITIPVFLHDMGLRNKNELNCKVNSVTVGIKMNI